MAPPAPPIHSTGKVTPVTDPGPNGVTGGTDQGPGTTSVPEIGHLFRDAWETIKVRILPPVWHGLEAVARRFSDHGKSTKLDPTSLVSGITLPPFSPGSYIPVGLGLLYGLIPSSRLAGDALYDIASSDDPRVKTGEVPTRQQLIEKAQEVLREFRDGSPSIPDYGDFLLATELTETPSRERTQVAYYQWGALRDSLKSVMAATKDPGGRVEGVLYHLYNNDQRIRDYRRGEARFSALLGYNGGNCEANTKLVVSSLASPSLGLKEPWRLGIQVFRDHMQPVVVNASSHEVWDLMGNVWTDEIRAPVYDPRILYLGFLKGQGVASPMGPKELLLLRPNRGDSVSHTAPREATTSNSSFDFGGFGSGNFYDGPIPERAKLPSPYRETGLARGLVIDKEDQAALEKVERCKRYVRDHPQDPKGFQRLAEAQRGAFQYEDALRSARRAVDLSGGDIHYTYGLISILENAALSEEAISEIDQLLERTEGGRAFLHFSRAQILDSSERIDEAMVDYRKAIELWDQGDRVVLDKNYVKFLADSCSHLGYFLATKGDRKGAAHFLKRALGEKPDHWEAQLTLEVLENTSDEGLPESLRPIRYPFVDSK